ncbi:MAG: hypothetical protein V3T86_07250 [Planctomycetota bacterium]
MKQVALALMTCLRAPWRRLGYVLLIWSSRLLPIAFVVGIGAYDAAHAAGAHDPRSRYLLDGAAISNGYAQAWTQDFHRDYFDGAGLFFWMAVTGWFVVTLLSGGLYARLALADRSRTFATECGRLFGRFFRLGLGALVLLYVADVGINVFLEHQHFHEGQTHHLQTFRLESSLYRGALFLLAWHLIGMLHSYARINLVMRDGRSAILAWLRALGMLLLRLPKLLVLEFGLGAFHGVAILLAWFAIGNSGLLSPHSSWVSIGIWLALAASVSYLRTGLEVGAVDARCDILAPGREPESAAVVPTPKEPAGLGLKGTEDLPPLVVPPT